MKKNEFKESIIIAGKYILGPYLGGGSFGEVYLVNLLNSDEVFAMKKVYLYRNRKMRKLNHPS